MTKPHRLLAALAGALACDADVTVVGASVGDLARAPSEDGADANRAPAALERSTKKNAFPARGALHLGYNLDALARLHALAATVEIPKWAAAGSGEPAAMRDDDLATGWTCTPERERPCAIGLRFPAPVSVKAVRVHAWSEPHVDRPRIAGLRVHSDEGWVEAILPDEPGAGAHVVLGKEITTTSIAIEVVRLHGDVGRGLLVGEVEAYGSRGEARPPWTFDPRRVVVSPMGGWVRREQDHALPRAFVSWVDDAGGAHPLFPGSALFGRADDRLLLLERIESTSCARHLGSHALVDRRTRVVVPLGDLGGVPTSAWRAANGSGWAVGRADDEVVRLGGAFAGDDDYTRRRTPRLLDRPAADVLGEWGLEPEPVPRGGGSMREPPSACVVGSDDLMTALALARREPPSARPGEWLVCDLGGGAQLFVTDHGPCGGSWDIAVLDGDGKLVGSARAGRKRSRVRLRRIDEGRVLVEIGGHDDVVELRLASASGLVALGDTALAVDPPAACRARCDAGFTRPQD